MSATVIKATVQNLPIYRPPLVIVVSFRKGNWQGLFEIEKQETEVMSL